MAPEMVEHYLRCSRERARTGAGTRSPRKSARSTAPRGLRSGGFPSGNTLDRATSMLPGLLRERLDELGLGLHHRLPDPGVLLFDEPEEEVRRACCRAQEYDGLRALPRALGQDDARRVDSDGHPDPRPSRRSSTPSTSSI